MKQPVQLMCAIAVVGVMSITVSWGHSADMTTCADDLDRLRRAAGHAGDKATEAASMEDDVESARSAVESGCTGYFRSESACRSAREELRNVLEEQDDAQSAFASEYDTVQRRIRDIQSSCALPKQTYRGALIPGVAPEHQDTCARLRIIAKDNVARGRPVEELQSTCAPLKLSAKECQICLSVK